MFAMLLGEETLGPDKEEIAYTEVYRDRLEPGHYKVTGVLVARNRPMSASVEIEVRK